MNMLPRVRTIYLKRKALLNKAKFKLKSRFYKKKSLIVEHVNEDGDKEYKLNGKLHREDGPAIEGLDGYKEWRINGKLHREDGPAVQNPFGYNSWYLHGKLHRKNGPAIEYVNGDKGWYLHGKLHREDGPAIENNNGDKYWYIEGKKLTEEEFNKLNKIKITKTEYKETKDNFVDHTNGTQFAKNNNLQHSKILIKNLPVHTINLNREISW